MSRYIHTPLLLIENGFSIEGDLESYLAPSGDHGHESGVSTLDDLWRGTHVDFETSSLALVCLLPLLILAPVSQFQHVL